MRLFKPEPLKRWYLLYPNQVEREAKKFQLRLIELARNMGFEISTPRPYVLLMHWIVFSIENKRLDLCVLNCLRS